MISYRFWVIARISYSSKYPDQSLSTFRNCSYKISLNSAELISSSICLISEWVSCGCLSRRASLVFRSYSAHHWASSAVSLETGNARTKDFINSMNSSKSRYPSASTSYWFIRSHIIIGLVLGTTIPCFLRYDFILSIRRSNSPLSMVPLLSTSASWNCL